MADARYAGTSDPGAGHSIESMQETTGTGFRIIHDHWKIPRHGQATYPPIPHDFL